MAGRRHYIRNAFAPGARWVGVVLMIVPVAGLVAARDLSLHNWIATLPWILFGAVIAFASLGLTPDDSKRAVWRWYGVAFAPLFALPLRTRLIPVTELREIKIRGGAGGSGRGPNQRGWRVLLIPATGYDDRIAITHHFSLRGAEAIATELAARLGVPLER
jgi:hypothetical protein